MKWRLLSILKPYSCTSRPYTSLKNQREHSKTTQLWSGRISGQHQEAGMAAPHHTDLTAFQNIKTFLCDKFSFQRAEIHIEILSIVGYNSSCLTVYINGHQFFHFTWPELQKQIWHA
jgi:hypothetical protein